MTNEIKEILDNFKIYEDRYKKCNETQFIIFYKDIHLLLDYITNLQEDNKRIRKNITRRKQMKIEDFLTFIPEGFIYSYDDLSTMVINYQERINKAVDFISSFEYYIPEDNIPELLKILKGE